MKTYNIVKVRKKQQKRFSPTWIKMFVAQYMHYAVELFVKRDPTILYETYQESRQAKEAQKDVLHIKGKEGHSIPVVLSSK